MIWVYTVVMMMIEPTTSEKTFIVFSPNTAFTTEESCQKWREADMIRLYNSRPNESAEAMSKCTSFPFNVDKGVQTLTNKSTYDIVALKLNKEVT